MRNFWKYIAASAIAVFSLPLVSCDDDESNDPYDINYLYIYQPHNSFATLEYKGNGSAINPDFPDPHVLLPVRLTKPAPHDIPVHVTIDPSLVDEYNAANNTEYVFLEGAQIVNPTLVINTGKYTSDESVTVSYDNREGFMTGDENYILPIVINTDASDVRLSKSSRIFLTYKADYTANVISISGTDISLDTDQSNWQDGVRTINVQRFLNATYKPYETVTVQLAIDQSKVSEYNDTYGTDYVFMSDAVLNTSELTLTPDMTTARLSITTGDLTPLTNGENLIIPISITSVNGGMAEIDGEHSTAYITIAGTPPSISYSTSPVGTLKGFNNLSATVDGRSTSWYGTEWTDVIYGDTYEAILAMETLEIDLGEVCTLASFRVKYNSSRSNQTLILQTSVDGSSYTDWGSVDMPPYANSNCIILSKPKGVRYLKIKCTNPSNSRFGTELAGINFYVK